MQRLTHGENSVSGAIPSPHEVGPASDLQWLLGDVVSRHEGATGRRQEKRRQDLDEGALSRTVGAQEAEAFSAVHREVDSLERAHLPRFATRLEDAGQGVRLERRAGSDQNASPTESTPRSLQRFSSGSGGVRKNGRSTRSVSWFRINGLVRIPTPKSAAMLEKRLSSPSPTFPTSAKRDERGSSTGTRSLWMTGIQAGISRPERDSTFTATSVRPEGLESAKPRTFPSPPRAATQWLGMVPRERNQRLFHSPRGPAPAR